MNPNSTPLRSALTGKNAIGSTAKLVVLFLCAWSLLLLPDSLQGQTTTTQTSSGCATSVCNSPINLGNFGVDADLNANEPGSLSGTSDDWFDSPNFPGQGIGVIGTTAATSVPPGLSATDFNALVQASPTRNLTYVQRMAFPNIYPRLITATTGHLLLDAVAARDNHSAGTSVDSSAFGPGSKNGANPGNWNIVVSGVPQKNDLIDVGGHLRRSFDFANNIPGALLGYAFATTRNTSGDSHVDFEIFRTAPIIIAGKLTNTGPDSGHTTTRFVPGGLSLQQPGDVQVSVDYANGGNNPCASVRVWVNPNNVDGTGMDTADYNALLVTDRIYTFTGTFSSDNSTAPYGYAEIRPKNGFAGCLFASVTNKTTTPSAGPWGNLSAQNASYSTTLEKLQMVEVAIDFSAFGLDIDPLSGPCFNLFGSLLIKTRSSTSFTAAMKDFAGPFIFGNFQEVNANAGEDKNLACSVTATNLDGSSTTPGASYQWVVVPGSGGHIVSGANTATPLVDSAGTYVLTVSNPALASCVATDTVSVFGTPDTTPPAVTCPPDVVRNCIDEIPAPPANLSEFVAQGGSAFDISGVINIVSVDGPLIGGSCGGTITRTFALTDECNNATTCIQTITIDDNIPPIIVSGPGDLSLGCNPVIPAADTALVTATDNCTGFSLIVLPDSIEGTCNQTLIRTYVATDNCGNTATHVQTITYKIDTEEPVFTHSDPAVQNGSTEDIGCNPGSAQINSAFGTVSASDNCDAGVIVSTNTGAVQSSGCMRSQTRTWSAADSCGNNAVSFARTITWKEDLIAPTINATGSVPNNSDLGCNPTSTQIDAALGTATATDNCDNLTPNVSTAAVVSNGCNRSQTRTWTAIDLCGNTATTVTRTITWKEDFTAPVITASGSVANNSDLGCNPGTQAINAALGTATVSDACDNLNATVSTDAVVSTGCLRSQTRRWNVVDLCGNTATEVTRTITWKEDLTAPTINASGSVPNNSDLGCNPTSTDIDAALGTATATDNCDNVTPNVSTASVISNGCNRSQTRTWTAIDLCSNTATTVTRTITWKVDLTAPVITASGSVANNSDLGCNPSTQAINAALGTATVSDACDNLNATVSTDAVVSTGCLRSQTRRWNVIDLCGNTATEATRTITWKVDVTAPVINASGSVANNSNLGCNPTATQIDAALGTATVTDACDNLTATVNTSGVIINGCDRSQTRTWNVTDACGNTATSVSRTINWKVDVTAPVINATGSVANNSDLGCNPSAQAIDAALGTAIVIDACDNLNATVSTDAVVSTGCLRSQTRRWNITDLCGNTATEATRTITWKVDATAPVINASGSVANNSDLGCNPTSTQIDAALGTATVTEACDNISPTVNTSGVIINGCNRSQTRTWTITDACGNTATPVSRTITWKVDVTAPVINATGSVANNSDLGCNPSAQAIDAALGTASVADACDNLNATVSTDAVVANGCLRSQTRRWNITDLCGNTATEATRTITWKVDATAPVIIAIGSVANNSDLGCNPTLTQIDAALGTATVTEACDNLSPNVNTTGVIITGCNRSQTRTWTITDACGNTATPVSRTITWKVDVTAPVINATGSVANNSDLGCNPTSQSIDAALGTATITEACDNLTPTVVTSPVVSNGCLRSQTRQWTAVDLCGNTATSVSRTITWKEDLLAPVVTCNISGNITVCAGTPVTINSSATDNCDGTLPVTCTRSDGQSIGSTFTTGVTTVNCTATDACGNSSTCTFTVTVLANPTCSISQPAAEPLCGSTGNTLAATTANATSYSWSVTTSDPSATPWVITGGAGTPTVTYTAGSGEATFTLTVTNSLNGVDCISQCQVTFSCQGSRFCTYTQGYYGNRGGMSCAGVRTSGFLNLLLGSGPLVTGSIANNRSFTISTLDVASQCIYDKLPGGGTATQIPTGNHTCQTVPMAMMRSNGSLKNVLLAQTITLGLNLRIPGSALGGLHITGKYLLTYASSGSGCTNTNATPIPGTELVKLIPGPVVNYLGANNTVADLLNLANQALGGTAPAGAPSLSAISNAVAAFNEGFDACRFFGGFFNTDPLQQLNSTTRVLETNDLVGVVAFPNPAYDRVSIEFALNGFDSDVIVEVFDLNGARVADLFNANAEADVAYRAQWDAATVQPGVYFYRVSTSRGNYTGKITIVR